MWNAKVLDNGESFENVLFDSRRLEEPGYHSPDPVNVFELKSQAGRLLATLILKADSFISAGDSLIVRGQRVAEIDEEKDLVMSTGALQSWELTVVPESD